MKILKFRLFRYDYVKVLRIGILIIQNIYARNKFEKSQGGTVSFDFEHNIYYYYKGYRLK